MVLEVEVQAGNQTASSFAQPELWALVDGLEERSRPAFLRGDCQWGTERALAGAEQRQIPYVFKLKQTANVKKLIGRLFGRDEWEEVGQQWQGLEAELRLSGWSQTRRVVVLRRPLQEKAEGVFVACRDFVDSPPLRTEERTGGAVECIEAIRIGKSGKTPAIPILSGSPSPLCPPMSFSIRW